MFLFFCYLSELCVHAEGPRTDETAVASSQFKIVVSDDSKNGCLWPPLYLLCFLFLSHKVTSLLLLG